MSSAGARALAITGLSGGAMPRGETDATSRRHVVVVGGGWGGTTAAKYVRLADPSIEVVSAGAEPHVRVVSVQWPLDLRGRERWIRRAG